MKKLLSIFVALLALGLFALPAMAVSDSGNVSVTVDVSGLITIDVSGVDSSQVDVTADDLTVGYADIDTDDTDDVVVDSNAAWSLTGYDNEFGGDNTDGWFVKYDTGGGYADFGTSASPTTLYSAQSAGEDLGYNIDLRVYGLDWTDGTGNDTVTLYFTAAQD